MAGQKKIIDENGKLFGKVNVIDILVLALVLVVGVMLGMKFMGRDSGLPGMAASTELEYTVISYRLSPSVYAQVEKEIALGGDHAGLMANGEMLAGCYIVSVDATPHMETSRQEDGSLALVVEPTYVDAVFTIRAVTANPTTQLVGTQEVRIGRGHIVKTKTFEIVNGLVLTCAPVEAAG